MVRKLAIAAFTVSALSTGVAKALGLGEASVQSALNQPLSAEIQLVNVRDLEQNEILTNLATREEFQKAGVDRVFFLSDLRFKVVDKPDGTKAIQVTSSKAVREPFINFLVEVTWPTGRLLREYALLIDPPTFTEQPAAPVQAPQAPATTTAQAPARQVSQAPAPAPSTPARSEYQGGTYGPTGRDDTMWSIAMATRPDSGVSPQQMMLAIQDLNPDAFFDGNINRLKAGQVLRLPTRDQIDVRTAREAIGLVSEQNREFANRTGTRSVDAAADKEVTASAPVAAQKDELRVVVAKSGDASQTDAAVSGESGSGAGSATDAELAIAKERLDQTSRENEELKSRLEDLESQLENMQRLISLKDDQLAALQSESGQEQEAAQPDMTAETAADTAPTASEAEPAEAVSEEGMTGSAQTETMPESDMAEAPAGEDMATAESGEMAQPEPEATEPAVIEEEKPVVKPKPQPVPETVSEESFIDMIKNNVIYQIALAAGGVIVLLILWLLSRSKARKEEAYLSEAEGAEDNDTIITFDEDEGDAQPEGDADTGAAPGGSDPVAEADVYVAYQKYDQATQVLETALEEEPDNNEYRLKLLEVAGDAKDGAKFAAAFAALEASGDADVLERASDIKARYPDLSDEPEVSLDDLESQLMGGDTFASESDLEESDISEDFELDVDVDNQDELEDTVAKSEAEADFIQEEDFNLDEETSVEEEDNLDIDFDLSDIDLDEDTEASEDDDTETVEDTYESIEYEHPGKTADAEDASVLDETPEPEEDAEETVIQPPAQEQEFDLGLVDEEDADELDSLTDSEALTDEFDLDLDVNVDADASSEEFDLDADLSDELMDMDAPAEKSAPAGEGSLDTLDAEEELNLDLDEADMDLSLDEPAPSVSPEDEALEEELGADLDFDLDEELNTSATEAKDEDTGELSEEVANEFMQEVDSLDDDLDLSAELDESSSDDLGADEIPELGDIEEASLDDELTSESAPDLGEDTAEDVSDADKAPESADVQEDEFVSEMEEDFDFLSDTDESATKLDLARAYIDMGDKEGARDILEEVVEEGNDDQKQEASDLLKGLE